MKVTCAGGACRPKEIARRVEGTLVKAPNAIDDVTVRHICTDSREADEDTLFVALPGERVDGHDFLPAAARLGARVFLCAYSRCPVDLPTGCVAILVNNTEAALARLAATWREEALANTAVVAVTGSVGKTTTKEMMWAVLSAGAEGLANRHENMLQSLNGARQQPAVFKKDGNFNSTVGLPLSVQEIPAKTPAAVLEMGMSARGEIQAMSTAVHPDIGVVSNIGTSHLERLGTRENIALAKLEIADGMRKGGILLLNGDEALLLPHAIHLPADVQALYVSLADAPHATFRVRDMVAKGNGTVFSLTTPDGILSSLFVPAPGEHMVWAAAFSAAVGCLLGLTAEEICRGLLAYRPAAMRQTLRTVGHVTFLEDYYNAAPESMKAALSVLALTAKGRRVAVLGDMLELGPDTERLHRQVGEEAVRAGVDLLITVGDLGAHIAAGARAAGIHETSLRHVPDASAYEAEGPRLAALFEVDDTVLFKASRAMGLEALVGHVDAAIRREAAGEPKCSAQK